MSDQILIDTADGKGLTKEQYKARIETISKSIDKGAKTYSSEEVRDYVLNRKG